MNESQFLQPCDWSFPVPIRYGPGRLAELPAMCRGNGMKNPLVVTDRASRELWFVGAAVKALKGADLDCAVFSDVSPNPTDQDVAGGRAAFLAGGHDGVIALGGGSGMDAGKAISLLARTEQDLWQFDFDAAPDDSLTEADFVPLICIPTTAGTGAETESTAMLTDTRRLTKRCVWHPAQRPCGVILDPEITVSLPRTLTAWTGCDALVHAVEAYCVDALHPLCDGAALEALRLIYRWLPRAIETPNSIEARGAMLIGSCLAGVSFLKGLGLVHSISHMVGAEYQTQHGLTNAVLLPVVLRYNAPAIAAKIPPMCQAMGLEATDFDSFLSAVNNLLDRCDIPTSLADLGVAPDAVGRLAEKAFTDVATLTNPRPAGTGDIAGLIEQALKKAR